MTKIPVQLWYGETHLTRTTYKDMATGKLIISYSYLELPF